MNKSIHYEEVAFIVHSSLCDNSSGKLVMVPKGTVKTFDHSQARTYKSYCYEFCGQCEIPFRKCKFSINNKEIEFDKKVLDPCEIFVLPNYDFISLGLQNALSKIFATGLYSDLNLEIKNEIFKVHRGILMARSEKFFAMLNSALKESHDKTIKILSDCSPIIFKLMLNWIYTGECFMPENIFETCKLLVLADEYLLSDLMQVCEEDILLKINNENVVKILTLDGVRIPEKCECKIFTECKNVLLSEFEEILQNDPDVEKKLISVPGLITKILLHANDSKQLIRKSSVKMPKKKVRFNLSTKSENFTRAETHSLIDTNEFDRSHEASQSDTQSLYSLLNNNQEPEEKDENENGSPRSP